MKKHINKIYIFGDSILKGVMYSLERARYVTYKEERFSQLTENGIEVYNYSHMGSKAADGLEKMMNKLNETNCDENTLVIIEFGGNDSDPCGRYARGVGKYHLPLSGCLGDAVQLFGNVPQADGSL